jgi:hypothetical protein
MKLYLVGDRETGKAAGFTWAARIAWGFPLSTAAVVGVWSSFGYLWVGTSFRNVAPSQHPRMTDELATKRRVLMS